MDEKSSIKQISSLMVSEHEICFVKNHNSEVKGITKWLLSYKYELWNNLIL